MLTNYWGMIFHQGVGDRGDYVFLINNFVGICIEVDISNPYLNPWIVFVWKLVDMQILWFLFLLSTHFVSAAAVIDHCGENTWKPALNYFLSKIHFLDA